MDSKKLPRTLGTHDGSFHADEVTACSLLLVYKRIDKDKVRRTRDPAVLATCDYVCDVGGEYAPSQRRFDHHQAEYQGPMSSAGMILLYLKEQGDLDAHFYDYFNRSLVMGVDAHDNGVAKFEMGTCTFSQVVSNFLPIEYEASAEEMNEAFFRAVDFAAGHLTRLRDRHLYVADCRSIVQEKMKTSGYCLVFESSLPWIENFFDMGGELHPAQFVIMPSGPHWKLRGIPPSMSERMKVRRPLPERWAGLQDEDLKKASGIDGAVFCHKGRFISIWKTFDDAMKALHIALERR